MTWTDTIAWLGLLIGAIALVLTAYGIYDIRRQVHDLVELQGNLLCAELIPEVLEDFVTPTKIDLNPSATQKFLIVQRILHPKEYDAATGQRAIQRQGLWLANELVERGMARWKPNIDLAKVRTELAECAKDLSVARMKRFLGDRMEALF